jgi:hypothetical protein
MNASGVGDGLRLAHEGARAERGRVLHCAQGSVPRAALSRHCPFECMRVRAERPTPLDDRASSIPVARDVVSCAIACVWSRGDGRRAERQGAHRRGHGGRPRVQRPRPLHIRPRRRPRGRNDGPCLAAEVRGVSWSGAAAGGSGVAQGLREGRCGQVRPVAARPPGRRGRRRAPRRTTVCRLRVRPPRSRR